MVQYFPVVTGSLTVTGSINVSGGITASGGISISGSIASATSASYAATASFANAFTVAGNLTAQTLVVQTITSSVDFVTGSTRFGSILDNTHVFTGSMSVTGSGTFASNVIASSGFEVPNGQFYRARRTSSNLLTDMIGIPSGTNDVRILTTGGLNVINGSLATMLGIADNGAATFTSSTFNVATFNSTYGQMSIGFANSGTAFAYIGSGNSVTSDGASNDDLGIGTGGLNKSIIFATGAGYARRMTITSGGNVGIGIAAPNSKLSIFESTGTTTSTLDLATTGNAYKGRFGMFANNFYITSNWYYNGTQNADNLSYGQGSITFGGGGTIDFQTSAAGSTSPTTRMTISSIGDIVSSNTPFYSVAGGPTNISNSYVNIFTAASNSSYILSVRTTAGDGTYGVFSILNEDSGGGGDKVVVKLNGNNISCTMSGNSVALKCDNVSTYNMVWAAIRIM